MSQNYTIRRGDTLSTLANRYGTTVSALAQANNIKDPDRISAGAKLKVPDRASAASQTHTIRRGDTLGALATRYGTTVNALAQANHIKNPDRIFAGAKLKVPDRFDAKPTGATQRPQSKGDAFEKPRQPQTQEPRQPQAQAPRQPQAQAPQQPQPQAQAPRQPQAQAPRQPQPQAPRQPQPQVPQQTQDTRQTGNTSWKDKQTNNEYASRDGVPVFNQGDGDWKHLKLKGTGSGDRDDRRIGNKGCAISAAAMAVSALSGETITPAEMDRHLDAHGGYNKSSSVLWPQTTTVVKGGPRITADRQFKQKPSHLDQHLAQGKPVVIGVDRTGDRKTDHWMTVTGKNPDGSYRVNDPAGGKTITMELRQGALVSRDVPRKTYTFTGDAVYFSGGSRKLGQSVSAPTQAPRQPQASQQPQAPKQAQQTAGTSRPSPAGNGYKSIDPSEFLSVEKGTNSLAAIIIGNAEGTRTPQGGMTSAFGSHRDPGNNKKNVGSFSYQDTSVKSAAEADRKQLMSLRAALDDYKKAAKAAGLDPNNALLVATFFDSRNQGQVAGERFLKQLPYLKEHGITRDTALEARMRTWYNPATGGRYLNSKGSLVGGGLARIARRNAEKQHRPFRGEVDVRRTIRADQARRIDAMITAMKAQGLA